MKYFNGLLSGEQITGGSVMKKALVIMGVLILLVILYPMFYVPCTPPSERAMCKKEIGYLRGYLLSEDFFGVSFFSDYFPSSTNGLEFRVGEFCAKVNQISRERKGKEVFRVVPSPDEMGSILVDRWGTPYNFCTVAERQRNHWDALKYSDVSNVVIWSSGPNKINEYGSNDDVGLRDSPYP